MRHPLPLSIAAMLATLAIIPASATGARAQAAPAGPTADTARIAVVVTIATPPGATEAVLKNEFEKSVPRYQQIPGLIRKYFTIGDGNFGGIYYWSSRAAAEAWFNEAWRARAEASYHAKASVTYFSVPVAIDGAKP